jgi:hypothetical protein
MDAQFWATVLPWATIVFSVLALASTGGSIVARDKVAAQKNDEIRKLQPRKISDEQRAMLIEKLRSHPSRVGMVTPLMDGEARDYAESLGRIFEEAGWDVAPVNAQSLNTFSGYVILGASDGRMGATLDHVAAALRSIGVDVRAEPVREGSLGGQFLPDTGYIIIGRKP